MSGYRVAQADRLTCPTCEGSGKVISFHFGRERTRQCPTCGGHGVLDAGVWPYEPYPHVSTAQRQQP